jgi:hypothetical protein
MTYNSDIDRVPALPSATEAVREKDCGNQLELDRWFTRRVAPTDLQHHCPHCQSIIYSRRHRLCGVCSLPLPRELLFTDLEAQGIDALLRREKRRYKEWLAKTLW